MSSGSCRKLSNRSRLAGASAIAAVVAVLGSAWAASDFEPEKAWIAASIGHLQRMPHDREAEQTKQVTPPIIRGYSQHADPAGVTSAFMPGGSVVTSTNAFFQDLGSNGRTCFSCHQPQSGWGMSVRSVRDDFDDTSGYAPIFRPVDGAVCPTADFSTLAARREAYHLLLDRGLIRIAIVMPAGAQFSITSVADRYGCNTNPATGLTSPTSGIVSTYRRPLPSANLAFINAIMWDGREASLASQATDATNGHAQATTPPTPDQVSQIVAFETGVLAAQSVDDRARDLDGAGATGGPEFLPTTVAAFFPGINDPLGGNPKGTPFTSVIFTLYDAWAPLTGSWENEQRAQIARGQAVFNTKPIAITGVAGLDDVVGQPTISGFCGTCHDSPNVGNHSLKLPINIGIAGSGPLDPIKGTGAAPVLDIDSLPVFTVSCDSGPLKGTTYSVTDLGRAMISGQCADIGKFKGPILRSLAARAPYFHNGSARTLADVVTFYDQRFKIGFTEQEKKDLAAFLASL
jgi:cytochrome c peroxidase